MDVVATDLAVTALAERAPLDSDDAALRMLDAWAAEIDARPIAVEVAVPGPAAVRRRPRGTARSVAAMTVALTLSSTGIAAAVQGNPFATLHYVVDKFGNLGPHDHTSPVDLLGTRNPPIGDPRQKEARVKAEQDNRPSRSRSPRPDVGTGADGPIVAHRVPTSSGSSESNAGTAGEARPPRHRQRPLAVRRPDHDQPVDRPKPGSAETPPIRPELTSTPLSPR